jgi:hypothetical protein
MKNLNTLFSVVVLLAGSTAYSADLHCGDKTMQDAVLSADFTFGTPVSVTLNVPEGETSSKPYHATCYGILGAEEPAYECNVMTSSDSGYKVELQSNGSLSSWSAYATHWNMKGEGPRENLPCDNKP